MALHTWVTVVLCILALGPLHAEEVRVAVAANFAPALDRIATDFERASGHRLRISVGSTGKLYAQIVQGAPFDVFLAADVDHPERLEARGLTVPGSRFTYAVGRLVLSSASLDVTRLGLEALDAPEVRHIALANPRTAPYGVAARQVLERTGRWATLRDRAVFGESVGQTFQFVASENADVGLIALSTLELAGEQSRLSGWLVPMELHDAIEQQAVLLVPGASRPGARELLSFLRSPIARQILDQFGYLSVLD